MSEPPSKPLNWTVHDLCYAPPPSSYAIIILNAGLRDFKSHSHIIHLWKKAGLRLCVDGATNDFHSLIHKPEGGHNIAHDVTTFLNGVHDTGERIKGLQNGEYDASNFDGDIPLPDIISGDFDSVDSHVLDFYSTHGVKIIHTPDQNQTDFTKALHIIKDHVALTKTKITHIIVVAAINSTRFDHVIGHINALYKIYRVLPFPVIMMSQGTLLWLFDTGVHKVTVPRSLLEQKELSWCGYASFLENVAVSTSGLKYDVSDRVVSFGKLISTSNTYAPGSDGNVLIDCSGPLLWFMGWDPPTG